MPRFRVLLVEDNPSEIALVQAVFQEVLPGTIVHVARHGREARHLLGYEPGPLSPITVEVDLILLDLSMPTMDGLEFLRMPRSADHPPICVFSGGTDSRYWAEARLLGAAECRGKPADLNEYESVLRSLVERWSGGQEKPGKSPDSAETARER